MVVSKVEPKRPPEICPACGAPIKLRFEGELGRPKRIVPYNLDGTSHQCDERPFEERHPIGQTVTGKVIKDFQLRGRRLTITLEDGNVLSVSAKGIPLTIMLEGPAGIMQE